MMTGDDVAQLKPFQARSIIEELRKGSVPADYVHSLYRTIRKKKIIIIIK